MNLRRSLAPFALVSATALLLAVCLPVYATAAPERPREAERAAHAQERATRKAALAEERAARRAARARERTARAEERAARKTARAEERAARKAARKGSAKSAPGSSETRRGPAGDATPSPPPGESGAHAGSNALGGCHVSVNATSRRITAGETVSLSGKLACPTSASVANQPVTVYQAQGGAGASGRSVAGTATTQADGSYQVTPAVFTTNTVFFARSERAHGAHTAVKVAPAVTLGGPPAVAQLATAARGYAHAATRNSATFTGTVSPAETGALVALQVEYSATGEHWRPVAFGQVGPGGSYSITHGFRTPGLISVRVVVHPRGHGKVASASEPLFYVIAQAQNPRLTIDTSADPISYGQSVTISGVAASAANQPVTLLARTPGGTFAAVSTSTTDASGSYTFTQSPLQNTSYRVTVATTMSTVLFEGVKFLLSPASVPSTAEAGQALTFTGTLAPLHAGQVVQLQRRNASGIGFNVVGTGTVNAESTYSINYTPHTVGTYTMRIKAPAGSGNQGSASEPFSLQVTPALVIAPAPEEASGP
jgi:hypothetical protein